MDVLPLDKTVDKWQRRTSMATPEFEDGVRNPRRDWATETKAAADSYKIGVQEAIAAGRFERGVEAAGTSKWQRRTLELGVSRWASGIAAALDEYRTGVGPFLAALERLTLPPRYARGDPRNYERVKIIGTTLRNLALKMAGR